MCILSVTSEAILAFAARTIWSVCHFVGLLLFFFEHSNMTLSHLDETPAGYVLRGVALGFIRHLVLILKDLVDLALGELGIRVLVVKMLSPDPWLGWVGPLGGDFVPVDRVEEGVTHDLERSVVAGTEAAGRVAIQKGDH